MKFHSFLSVKPDTCPQCNFLKKKTDEGARRKEPAKKKYHCDVCGRGYTTRSNLNQHAKVHDESRGHKCDVCWRVFPSNAHLTAHYKTHTGSFCTFLFVIVKLESPSTRVVNSCCLNHQLSIKNQPFAHVRLQLINLNHRPQKRKFW